MRVDRAFGFVDLCGFTEFTDRHDDAKVVLVLAALRTALREASPRAEVFGWSNGSVTARC